VQDSDPNRPRGHILLVEDHGDTASVLLRLLKKDGYEVDHATTVSAAEELASQHQFDLVISDLGLPDGTGLDLMKRLRKRHCFPAIALSGYGMDEDVAASKAAGFAEHFTKPIHPERLRTAIARLVETKPSK
jgi:CheY-like chemotaxis protein